MRILLITAKYANGESRRGAGYELTNFIPAMERLGHEVQVFDHLCRLEYTNFIDLNRALLRAVETFRPGVIFFIQHRYEIWTETLDIVRRSGIATIVSWATDDDWKYVQASRFFASHVDVCVTTYAEKLPMYHRDGCAHAMASQWGADAAQLAPPILAAECEFDVTFVGQAYGSRTRFVKAVQDAGLPMECFGFGWPNGPVDADRIAPILRSSVITLNFSGSGTPWERFFPNNRQVKARTFEVPGSGGFLLTEWEPGLNRYYDTPGQVDLFRNERDLVERIRYYLQHPEERDRAAISAHLRTVEEHTYDSRLAEVLTFAEQVIPQGKGSIHWNAFEAAAARHALTPTLQRLRDLVSRAFTAIWGERRGPRAARQAVFHASRLLAGAKTYSAAGWPGRMFYWES